MRNRDKKEIKDYISEINKKSTADIQQDIAHIRELNEQNTADVRQDIARAREASEQNTADTREDIGRLLSDMREDINLERWGASGITVMALILSLTGIAISSKTLNILELCSYLLIFATVYNFCIGIYLICKRWARKKRG